MNSKKEETFEILNLPDLVIDHLIKYLDVSSLRNFRLASLTTKLWVEQKSNFCDKWEIKIDSNSILEKLLKMNLPTHQFFLKNEQFQTFKAFPSFVEMYGSQITALKVSCYWHSIPCEFLVFFPNLINLELIGRWQALSFVLKESLDLKCLKSMKRLSLSCYISYRVKLEEYKIFQNFLQNFKSLEVLRIQILYTYTHTNPFLQYQIVSYLKTRSRHVEALELKLSEHEYYRIEDKVTQESELVPMISPLLKFVYEIELDLQGIESDTSFNSIELGVLSRVKTLGSNFLIFGENVTFLFKQMKHIEWMKLGCCLDTQFPSLVLNPRNIWNQTGLNNLTKLSLVLRGREQVEHLNVVESMVGIENTSVTMMELHVEPYYGENPKVNERPEGIVCNFLTKFTRLKHLSLTNWFSSGWINVLRNLEKLELHRVSRLTDEDFIGSEIENVEDPEFLKLEGLRCLTITDCYGITDKLFEIVLRRMRLKILHISGALTATATRMPYITKNGIKSLARSEFAESIQEFPYPWIHICDNPSWFQTWFNYFLGRNDTDNTLSLEQFIVFKRKHFKFCKT